MGDCWSNAPPSESEIRYDFLHDKLYKMLRAFKDVSLSHFTFKEFQSLLNLLGVETSGLPDIDEEDLNVLKESLKRLKEADKGKGHGSKDRKKGRKKK